MKILKQGLTKEETLKRLRKTRIFECSICGCVWEADNTEYKYQYYQKDNEEWYECKCPNCERMCQNSQATR